MNFTWDNLRRKLIHVTENETDLVGLAGSMEIGTDDTQWDQRRRMILDKIVVEHEDLQEEIPDHVFEALPTAWKRENGNEPTPASVVEESRQRENLGIKAESIPVVRNGIPYHFNPEVTGAEGETKWSAKYLPTGLTISPNGEISGTWKPGFWERNFAPKNRKIKLFVRDEQDRVEEAEAKINLNPEPVPSDSSSTTSSDGNRNNIQWPLVVAVAAVAVIAVILLATSGSNKSYPEAFGGSASNWSMIPGSGGSGWLYEGSRADINVPQGFRLDMPGASCGEPNSSGIYGPTKITRSGPLSLWDVPGETRCPPHSAGAQ